MTPLSVIHPHVPLRREAAHDSALETQLLFGDVFNAENIQDGWAFGQAVSPADNGAFPGYRGYVKLSDLSDDFTAPTHCVTALSAPVFGRADIKSRVVMAWSMNVRFSGITDGDFVRTEQGFLHRRHVRSLDAAPKETDFVAVAEQFLGRPYIWGGISSDGVDCSGLVQTSLRAAGDDAPRDASQQIHMGEAISQDALLKRGDLIFWKGHVGIMQDSKRLLHANAYHMMTASERLSGAVDRIGQQYGPITARRRLKD